MFFVISFLAALVGAGFAAAAAFMPDNGITGTPGAFLELLGAVGVTFAAGLVLSARFSGRGRAALIVMTALLALLTAVAAWFLMQDIVLGAMVVSFLAVLAGGASAKRKTVT